MIDLDVETTGLQWYAHDLFLVTFKDDYGDPVIFRHPQDQDGIQTWLLRPNEFRAWNAKFDFHFLDAAGYELPNPALWHDGMVQAHVIDEQRSVALKAVAGAMFGEEARDEEKAVKKWLAAEKRRRDTPPTYADVPFELMEPYARRDVELTAAVCDHFAPIFARHPDLQFVYEQERKVTGALFAVEKRGIPIDVQSAHRFEIELAAHLDGLEQRCVELAGIKSFNPNSSAQIYEALKRRGADLRYVTKTKTGYSMDAENLALIDDDLARAILEFRGDFKVLGTYLRPMLHASADRAPFIHNGRIHPNFRQVGARTGRMSASDPNIQNWPRDDLRLRYLLRADEGHKLISADLDSVELRLFGGYAGGGVKDALQRGVDLHSQVARDVGLGDRRRSTGVESARQRGKTFNYSMIYGAGVRSLRKAFGVSQDEARAMLRRYHSSYPEVAVLQSDMEWVLNKRGYVKTSWGRRLRLEPREAYRAVNYVIQGTAAEILKDALIRLDKAGVPVIACVHDEILAHVPAEDARDAAAEIEDALTEHPKITAKIPLKAEAQIVDRWSEAKDPDFRPSYS